MLGFAFAQEPKFLPPQPHKLLYADTVYCEAIARKDTNLLAEAFYLYGKTYESTGDLITSERWLLKSLRLLEPRGNSPELSRLYNRLGVNAIVRNKYEEALKYITRSVSIAEQTGSRLNMDRSYGNLANLHGKDWSEGGKRPGLPKPKPDSVFYYYQKIKQMAEQDRDSVRLAYIQKEIGDFFWTYHGDRAKLLSYYDKALTLYRAKKKDRETMDLQLRLADYYMDMHEYKAAWKMLESAQNICIERQYNVFGIKQIFEELYSKYYSQTGNWRLAFQHSEKLRNLQVSNYRADRDLTISRLGKEFEADKKDVLLKAKDKELILRSKAFKAQQRLTFVLIVLFWVTAGLSFVFYRLSKKNKKISEQNELLVREQNHRVKNNLQAISSLLSLQSDVLRDPGAIMAIEETRLRVQSIAILHRKLYDNKELARVFLPDFLKDLAKNILSAYGYENVRTDLEISPVYLSADKAVHLGLIINEIVTNACKYAFPKNNKPALRVECGDFNDGKQPWVRLLVADNGPGMDLAPLAATETDASNPHNSQLGFGLRLIKMESEQLYGSYKFSYENGTVFRLDFPQYKDETALAIEK